MAVAAAMVAAVAACGVASSDSSAVHRGGGPAAQRRLGPWRAWRCSSWSSACSCFRCGSGPQRWRRVWQSQIQAEQFAPGRLLASWLESAGSVRAPSQVAVSTFPSIWAAVALRQCCPLPVLYCAGCLCCSPLMAVLWDFLASVACLCLGGAMLVHCMSSWRLLGAAVRSCMCCMVAICAVMTCQVAFSCVVPAGASVLVRHISTALTGRETNGGDPMVSAAAAGCCHCAW